VLTMPPVWDPEGTVLITGGTGTIGGLIARHLVEDRGMRHIVLAGRRGAEAPGVTKLLAELQAAGASATVEVCDAADADAVGALVAGLAAERPLTAVVHSAAVVDDSVLTALTPERLDAVFRSKVDAAVNLREATRGLDLDAFVLFSAFAGILGSPGQANYAAANTFIDAYAHRLRNEGVPAVSLAWGLWAEASTVTSQLDEGDLARFSRGGVAPISTEHGLALFDAVGDDDRPLLVPVRLKREALRGQAASGTLPPLLSSLVRGTRRQAASGSAATDGPSLAERLSRVPAADHERTVVELVRGQLAVVLGHGSSAAIDPTRAFKDMGIDSLTAVELRNRLNAATGLRLPATLVFDYPTPEALAKNVLASLEPGDAPADEVGPGRLSNAEIWRSITAVPLERIREAGILGTLLRLAEAETGNTGSRTEDSLQPGSSFAEMEVDDLVRAALGDTGTDNDDSSTS
ncbi:beta-ketoacyl reductase, partial [Streptomyces sp. NPDC058045]|uniref:type I polyketide synthase n=1 Tax=Streptomyces sp. NPDC058045 TaxID=3346311 RepID=UPI0036EB4792